MRFFFCFLSIFTPPLSLRENTAFFCIVLMGKVCPICKREQPKAEYKEVGGKVNAKKKKKGKAAACNDCKAAGGDCVKLLSAAAFV